MEKISFPSKHMMKTGKRNQNVSLQAPKREKYGKCVNETNHSEGYVDSRNIEDYPEHNVPQPGRHDKFQFGTNPMKMTEFEKSRVKLEQEERRLNREKYIRGIQGRDGGVCEHEERQI